jgi:hypothetical protein
MLTIAGALASGCKSKKVPNPDANKLVVTRAVWGDMKNQHIADVTKIVAGRVRDNALSIQATPGLLGDPASM